MSRVLQYIPEAQGAEFFHLEQITDLMSDNQLQNFAGAYRSRRRDPNNVLLLSVLGFIVVAGLQRFYIGQVGMGILYLFTGGLCFIGTIVDIVNHKSLAQEYNITVANEIVRMV